MEKTKVLTRYERGEDLPTINVKVHNYPLFCGRDFGVEEDLFNDVSEEVYQDSEDDFWNFAEEKVKEVFGPDAIVRQAGRSGGWLILDGLAPVSDWSPAQLKRWEKFEKFVKETIRHLCGRESVRALIVERLKNG